MGWSLISRAEYLLRHDPDWEQTALDGPTIKEKAHEPNIGAKFWSRILTMLGNQHLKF